MQAGSYGQFEDEARRERDWPLERAAKLNQALAGNPLMGATQVRTAQPFDWGGFAAMAGMEGLKALGGIGAAAAGKPPGP